MTKEDQEVVTLAGGCFWCLEAVFTRLKGVTEVMPGYTGGEKANPTYDEVCAGTTGHAEAAKISFDPSTISFSQLLDVFWEIHDPTTLNQQGNDVGTQYRSAIYFHNQEQKEIAEQSMAKLAESDKYDDPIVTELVPAGPYYYDSNRQNAYCRLVIDPKIKKLLTSFSDRVERVD
jgi:peptide-methionine (S)-S-oxide reductase